MKYNNILLFFIIPLFLIVLGSCQNQSAEKPFTGIQVDSTYLQTVLEELGADKYMGPLCFKNHITSHPITLSGRH